MLGLTKLSTEGTIGRMVGTAISKNKCQFISPGKGDSWYDSVEPFKYGYRLYFKLPNGQHRIILFDKSIERS